MIHRYLRFPGGKPKALTFSYDDGHREDVRLVDIFRKHQMKCTFNLNSGMFGVTAKSGKRRRLTQEEALALYTEDLFEIACHGETHACLTFCDPIVACTEVIEDRKNLEKIFDRQIHGMAYAYGRFNDTVVSILKNAGIFYSRTCSATLKFNICDDWLRLPTTCHHTRPELVELADKFLKFKVDFDPKVFFVWGHSYEFADNDNWDLIEGFCDKLADNKDIWYCTNIELYNACADYERLERSADGSRIYNPSVRSVWVGDREGNAWEIKPGQTLIAEE